MKLQYPTSEELIITGLVFLLAGLILGGIFLMLGVLPPR